MEILIVQLIKKLAAGSVKFKSVEAIVRLEILYAPKPVWQN